MEVRTSYLRALVGEGPVCFILCVPPSEDMGMDVKGARSLLGRG